MGRVESRVRGEIGGDDDEMTLEVSSSERRSRRR